MTEQRAVRRYEQRVSGSGITGDEFQYIETVPASDYDALSTELAEAKAENENLPCGHRKRDHDDSYGGCVHCASVKAMHEFEAANEALMAEIERMRVDAQRWRATVGSARVRVLGSAGIAEPRPDGNAHIGVELWTSYNDPNYLAVGCEHDRQRLTQYADIAALIPAKGKGE